MNGRDECFKEALKDHYPQKLYYFIDSQIPNFPYIEKKKPVVFFRCNMKVMAWGIIQKSIVGEPRIISSHIFNGLRTHPQEGLVVLEMLGLDVEICLLVVVETILDS